MVFVFLFHTNILLGLIIHLKIKMLQIVKMWHQDISKSSLKGNVPKKKLLKLADCFTCFCYHWYY